MKQTAVEWLEFEINRRGPKEDNPPQWLKELYKQAKEMEKQQIMKAWIDGNYNIDSNGNPSENYSISDEKYYNETFKSE
jgi:HEPN domain-containing protein